MFDTEKLLLVITRKVAVKPRCSSWRLAEPELELPGMLIAPFSQFLHPQEQQILQFPKIDWICKKGTPNKYCWCVYFLLASSIDLQIFSQALSSRKCSKITKFEGHNKVLQDRWTGQFLYRMAPVPLLCQHYPRMNVCPMCRMGDGRTTNVQALTTLLIRTKCGSW